MTVGIDVRCLLDERPSGVGEYAASLIESMRGQHSQNLVLLANAYKRQAGGGLASSRLPGLPVHRSRWPNKLFNSLVFAGVPMFDRILDNRVASAPTLDRVWLPNLNFFKSKLPSIITVHDLSFEIYPEFFSPRMRLWHRAVNPRAMAANAESIIAVSGNTKRDLVNLYGIKPDKIKIIYSGVNESFYAEPDADNLRRVRVQYGLPPKFILFLGTLEPRKNIIGLMEAFEIMKKKSGPRLKDYQLVIAGPRGWLFQDIFRRWAANSVADHIKFIGSVRAEDLPSLYRLAQLFVFPSFYEGFGLPPLEAMAAGTQVAASFTGSLGEVLQDKARLFDPYNLNQMASIMTECLLNPPLQARLAEISSWVKNKYSWPRAAEDTWQVISGARQP